MITTGAISISNMMMVNHSLQVLDMDGNDIGNDGISAIARGLGNYKIIEWIAIPHNITVTVSRILAASLSSHPTIRELALDDNLNTEEGAQQILEAAVNNTVTITLKVSIDDENMDDKLKEIVTILENRSKQEVRDCCVM